MATLAVLALGPARRFTAVVVARVVLLRGARLGGGVAGTLTAGRRTGAAAPQYVVYPRSPYSYEPLSLGQECHR